MYLVLVVLGGSLLSLSLEGFDGLSVVPSNSAGEVTEGGALSERIQHDGLEGVGNDNLLHVRIRMRAAFEDFKSGHGSGSSGGLVWDHASDALPCNLGRGLIVPRTTSEGVGHGVLLLVKSPLSQESFNWSGGDDSLGSNDDDSLSVQELFGDDCSESAENVVLSVDDYNFFKHDYALYEVSGRIY